MRAFMLGAILGTLVIMLIGRAVDNLPAARAAASAKVATVPAYEDGSATFRTTYNGITYRVGVCLPWGKYGKRIIAAPCNMGGGPRVTFAYAG